MTNISTAMIACALACAAYSPAAAATEKVLLSFNGTDGQDPYAGLLDIKDTLYGTTEAGGTYGHGTVYSFNPKTGAESVLYSFGANSTDGASPYASLIDVKGTFYGTTGGGGAHGDGTVFSIVP